MYTSLAVEIFLVVLILVVAIRLRRCGWGAALILLVGVIEVLFIVYVLTNDTRWVDGAACASVVVIFGESAIAGADVMQNKKKSALLKNNPFVEGSMSRGAVIVYCSICLLILLCKIVFFVCKKMGVVF